MISDNWSAQNTPALGDYRKIAFGNGIFVAISREATNNNLLTSYDGYTWTIRQIGLKSNWSGLCFGDGKFIAVSSSTGVDNQVAISYDGITWTFHESADNTLRWFAVCYGANLYVAIAWNDAANGVMTSPDGVTWTQRTSVADNWWSSITYGDGLYVAVSGYSAGSGELVMTSPDGITWTERSTGITSMGWSAVAYGNGIYIIVGDAPGGYANKIGRSIDGINWSTIIASTDAGDSWNDVIYAEGLFVSVSGYGYWVTGYSQVMISSDLGLTWYRVTQPEQKVWRSLAYGNNILVALASAGGWGDPQYNLIMTSIDDTASLDEAVPNRITRFVNVQLEKG